MSEHIPQANLDLFVKKAFGHLPNIDARQKPASHASTVATMQAYPLQRGEAPARCRLHPGQPLPVYAAARSGCGH
jgi:hypothetical protein